MALLRNKLNFINLVQLLFPKTILLCCMEIFVLNVYYYHYYLLYLPLFKPKEVKTKVKPKQTLSNAAANFRFYKRFNIFQFVDCLVQFQIWRNPLVYPCNTAFIFRLLYFSILYYKFFF